jgi:hypothetical protein
MCHPSILFGNNSARFPSAPRMEDPILPRKDRLPTVTVRGDIDESLQPPDVSNVVWRELQPIVSGLPPEYHIEMAGSIEEAGKASKASFIVFPIMIVLMFTVTIFPGILVRNTLILIGQIHVNEHDGPREPWIKMSGPIIDEHAVYGIHEKGLL